MNLSCQRLARPLKAAMAKLAESQEQADSDPSPQLDTKSRQPISLGPTRSGPPNPIPDRGSEKSTQSWWVHQSTRQQCWHLDQIGHDVQAYTWYRSGRLRQHAYVHVQIRAMRSHQSCSLSDGIPDDKQWLSSSSTQPTSTRPSESTSPFRICSGSDRISFVSEPRTA